MCLREISTFEYGSVPVRLAADSLPKMGGNRLYMYICACAYCIGMYKPQGFCMNGVANRMHKVRLSIFSIWMMAR